MPRIAKKGKRRVDNPQSIKSQRPEAPPKASNPSLPYLSTAGYAEGDASDVWEETDDDEQQEEGPSNTGFPASYAQYNQTFQPTGVNGTSTNPNELSSTTRHLKHGNISGRPSGQNGTPAKPPQKPPKPSRLSKGYKHGNASIREQATTLGPLASHSQHPAFDFQHSFVPNMPGMMDPSITSIPNDMRYTCQPAPRGGYFGYPGYDGMSPYGQQSGGYYGAMQPHPAYMSGHMGQLMTAPPPPPTEAPVKPAKAPPPPPPPTEAPAKPASPAPPKEDPENIRLKAEIAALKAMAEKAKGTEREKETQEKAHNETQEGARRWAEEETKKKWARQIAEEEKARIRAEIKAEMAREEAHRREGEKESKERVHRDAEEAAMKREKEVIITRRKAEEERAKMRAEMMADMERDERRRREDQLWMRQKEAEIRAKLEAERREKEEEEASKARFRNDCERLAKLKMLKSIDVFMDTLKERLFNVELPDLQQRISSGQENGIRVERHQPRHRRRNQRETSPIHQPRLERSPSRSSRHSFVSAEAFEYKHLPERSTRSGDGLRHHRDIYHEREPQISEELVQRVAHAVAKILQKPSNEETVYTEHIRPSKEHQPSFSQTEPRTRDVEISSPTLENEEVLRVAQKEDHRTIFVDAD